MKHVTTISKTMPAKAADTVISSFFTKLRDLFNNIFGGIFGTTA